MGKIIVDIEVLIGEKFVTMFRNVKLEVEECSNKKMNQAFEDQHPRLLSRIPTHTDKWSGVKYRCAFECKVHWEKDFK
jgi:hypothetical protein